MGTHGQDQENRNQPVGVPARTGGAPYRASSAHQSVAPSRTKAIPRCVARRYWLTSSRSTSPDATIHQPIAP